MSNTQRAQLPPPPSSPPRFPSNLTEGAVRPFDAARAEALAGENPIDVELVTKRGTAVVSILPPIEWGYNALGNLRSGLIADWVQDVLSEQDFARFDSLRPTNREVLEFAQRWESQSGQNLGKSPASQ